MEEVQRRDEQKEGPRPAEGQWWAQCWLDLQGPLLAGGSLCLGSGQTGTGWLAVQEGAPPMTFAQTWGRYKNRTNHE